MTVNYFIKCPICGTITRMRSPAGYVYSTPIRIHCGKCNTVLTGTFISDNKRIRAYYVPSNCTEVPPQDYEYYGEASGEVLCNKLEQISGTAEDVLPPKPSPVFDFMHSTSLDHLARFVDYACYVSKLSGQWDSDQMKYTLFLNQQYEYIKNNFSDSAAVLGYQLDSDFNIVQYIYSSFFYDCGGVFKLSKLKTRLIDINEHFRHLPIEALNTFISFLDSDNKLSITQRKLFDIFFSFIQIAPHVLPAIGATYYDRPTYLNQKNLGLTTCTFEDIKQFYLDAFEALADCCDVVIGLDNIEYRASHDNFKNALNMEKFRAQKKGNRIKFLDSGEFFSQTLNLRTDANELRNAIGHNDYQYNGISQEITYNVKGTCNKTYLLEIAIECIRLVQSACILNFYIYELLRYRNISSGTVLPMHPLFYTKANSQRHCPCGSRSKYRKCCKSVIDQSKKRKTICYPPTADFVMLDFNQPSPPKFLSKQRHPYL